MIKSKIVLVCAFSALSIALFADNVFTEDLGLNPPLDTMAVDSEGDELMEMDELEVNASELPECLAGLFSHDTLILGCDLEVLPRKIIVRTRDGEVVYKIAPQFMLGDSTLFTHHPADSIYRNIWTDERVNPYGQPKGRRAYPHGGLPSAGSGVCDQSLRMASLSDA